MQSILQYLNNTTMGKGDKKSKRGKIAMGSFGVSRPRKTGNTAAIVAPTVAAAPKEAPAAVATKPAAKKKAS